MTPISSRLAPIAACSIALLILLSGCGKQKTRSLDQLPKTNRFISKDASIQGSYTVLDGKACKAYLGTDVREKGYQPIYVSITNNSEQTCYFSRKNIDLETVPAHVIAKQTETRTAARAWGYGYLVYSTLAAPAALGMLIGALTPGAGPIVIPLAIPGFVAATTALIVSTKNSVSHNRENKIFFDTHSLKSEYLAPQTTISGLIFVRNEDFRPTFEIALTNSGPKPVILASNPAAVTSVVA